MSNEYYNPSGTPANNSQITSPAMRAESALVQAGFDKMPGLSGKALKMVRVNAAGTGLESVGSAVITDGKTLTVDNSIELKGTDGTILDITAVNKLDGGHDVEPTFSATTNCTLASGAGTAKSMWTRMSDMVHVSGGVSLLSCTAGVENSFEMTIPVASTFTGQDDCNGIVASVASGAGAGASISGIVDASGTATKVKVRFIPPAGGAPGTRLKYAFDYIVK